MICRMFISGEDGVRGECTRCSHRLTEHQALGEVITTSGYVKDSKLFPWTSYSEEQLYAVAVPAASCTMIRYGFSDGDPMRDFWQVTTTLEGFLEKQQHYPGVIVSNMKVSPDIKDSYKNCIWTFMPINDLAGIV